MKPLNTINLLRDYQDMWVAVDKKYSRVLGSGHSFEQAISKAKSQHPMIDFIITYVSKFDLDYVG